MKFSLTNLLLLVASAPVYAATTYVPVEGNDISQASNSAKDVASITNNIGTPTAYTEYTNGAGNLANGATIQTLAQQATGPFLPGFVTLFGENHLDVMNSDSLQCNGSFDSQTPEICTTTGKKMILCTTLAYAWTQGFKAIEAAKANNGTEAAELWDDFYGYWYGDAGSSSSAGIQSSRDADFSTTFQGAGMDALVAGQAAAKSSPPNAVGMESAMNNFNKAIVSTFAQATLKYSWQAEIATLDDGSPDTVTEDKKWAEGFTYFACAAGIMDPELATFVNSKFDPRKSETVPDGLFCEIEEKMKATADLGAGATYADLNRYKDTPENFCDDDYEPEQSYAAGAEESSTQEESYQEESYQEESYQEESYQEESHQEESHQEESYQEESATAEEESEEEEGYYSAAVSSITLGRFAMIASVAISTMILA